MTTVSKDCYQTAPFHFQPPLPLCGTPGSAMFVSQLPPRFSIDDMHLDSDNMPTYLQARPSPALLSLVKFRLGAHWLTVER